jgi:hypothetical protein
MAYTSRIYEEFTHVFRRSNYNPPTMNTRTVFISSLGAALLSLLPCHSFADDERNETLVTGIVAPGKGGAATSTKYMGRELTKLSPTHARLLAGRELFIDADGVAYVKIAPAPVVRLTDELLSLTFAFPKSEKEALDIAGFPHTGAVVQSEKVLNEIVSIMEKAGLTKVLDGQPNDIDSFTFRKDYKGYEYGETVTKRDNGGFSVEFVALVQRSEDRTQVLRVRRFNYNFEKDDVYHPDGHIACYSEYDLIVGPHLMWRVPHPNACPMKRARNLSGRCWLCAAKHCPPANPLPPPSRSRTQGHMVTIWCSTTSPD